VQQQQSGGAVGSWRSGLAEGIRRHGFRKWYERELITSHAHLVLTLFSVLGLLATFEAYDRHASAGEQLTDVAALLLCFGTGLWALRRYLFLLTHAEATANQANCPRCQAYARLELVPEQPRAGSVQVRCRGCQHRWVIDE
jgi:hypothetical protein